MLFIITLLSLLALPSDKKRFPLLSKLDEKDNKDGFDHRYDKKVINLEQYFGELHTLEKNHKRLGILRTLENQYVSIQYKVALINQFQYLIENDSAMNISNGGLYDDWNIDF